MRLTLLSDGTTDQALLPIIRWLVQQHSTAPFEQNWADLRLLRHPPAKLSERVKHAVDLYPCDLLVVHRDAEREPPAKRALEIAEAIAGQPMPIVSMIPIRMTEAWLMFDEAAIRRAAGCPNGTMALSLPGLKRAEAAPDPKELLHEALRTASNLSSGRRKHFQPDIRRLADLIEDFAPLLAVPSFRAAEASLCSALLSLGLLRADRAAAGEVRGPSRGS
jgi:hypothetical protein